MCAILYSDIFYSIIIDKGQELRVSTIDLIILGILLDKPMNAYELANFIEKGRVDKLIKISKPAVYKNSKRLYKSGYLDGQRVREGELPEKLVYSINEKGQKKFSNLMEYFSSNVRPFFLDFNSFFWNIEKLETSEALEMLENLKIQLMGIKKWILQHEKEAQSSASFSSRMIIKQYRMMITSLVVWAEETIEDYKKEKNR